MTILTVFVQNTLDNGQAVLYIDGNWEQTLTGCQAELFLGGPLSGIPGLSFDSTLLSLVLLPTPIACLFSAYWQIL